MPPSGGAPAGINMSSILQALQRRQQGPLGGGGVPAQQQVSSPTGPSPMGASASPLPPSTQAPLGQLGNMPQQVKTPPGQQNPQNPALQAGQLSQGPQFDQETRDLAKSLVQRLLKGI